MGSAQGEQAGRGERGRSEVQGEQGEQGEEGEQGERSAPSRTEIPAETPIELAKNRAWPLLQRLEGALRTGALDEAGWYREVAAVIVPAYLAGDNPRAQSGSDGSVADWAYKRGLLADAVDRDGTFLDVGCASGYLMETLVEWCRERGHAVEPYGLDIAPELAALARNRLPHWAGRIYVGNAMTWEPPRRFDFVRTGLEYVPEGRQRDLVERLLRVAVAPGGRLIVGVYSEERDVQGGSRHGTTEARVAGWGYRIAGRTSRPHMRDARLTYRAFWIPA
jgi:SAM-dependent methyltransferase